MKRWTAEDVAKLQARGFQQRPLPDRLSAAITAPEAPRRAKYGNHKIQWQGEFFDSKHELQVYQDFLLEHSAGNIRGITRQVSIRIPQSKRRMRIDFLVIMPDGRQRWIDSKGMLTKDWESKRRILEDSLGIKVETI